MAHHHFLFTYSVSPTDEGDDKIADKVRRKIAEIGKWEKLKDVETAFVGKLYLVQDSNDEKRTEAEKDVTDVIIEIVKELNAYMDVYVHIALSVDGLGEHIQFRI